LQLIIVFTFRDHALRKFPQHACFRHGEELASRKNAEHRFAADVAFLTERNEIVEQRARNFSPQVAAHM
jgi:hypothetical protein